MPGFPCIIVVVGATGNQGGGVVRALLQSKAVEESPWYVRAITRDPNSAKAKSFLAENQTTDNRLSLVAGHVYDKSSLQDAFTGAYGVFGITSESYPGKLLEKKEDMRHEVEAGRNMILAAKECNVKHFIFSSLPDMITATGGQFLNIYHMNNKQMIEQIARENLEGFTALIPGRQVAQWTDASHDVGLFAARIFCMGIEKTRGKTYLVMSPRTAAFDMAKTFTQVTGQPAIHNPISAEEFGELAVPFVGPAFKEDAKQMMEWAAVMPADKICYGAMDTYEDDSFKTLGLKASSFEQWLRRSGWMGPD
ncbi:cinnamoyl- reductase [Trichoderma arundinaceum]|uniref:Cinnamoyl-reductase n=1 Tax=Trichoderma arundinaceum TaxID=490622 RepID=A0A395NZ94_TRIAR|nr:cinnamoyl- reductase [Trichoderma arundinaceum]